MRNRYLFRMTTHVLFVCLGNICRSPSAEAVFRTLAARAAPDLDLMIDSAGTSGWHEGEPPYGPMQRAAAARGYDLSNLRARRFVVDDFARFDLIVAMDHDNRAAIETLRPRYDDAGNDTPDGTPVRLFTDFAPETAMDHIPDPYYTRDFDQTLDLVETASRGLLRWLQQARS